MMYFLEEEEVDRISFLTSDTHRRNSNKPIYKKEFHVKLDMDKVRRHIEYLDGVVKRFISNKESFCDFSN